MKRRSIVLGMFIVLMAMNAGLLYGAYYIDYEIRTDDFWADVGADAAAQGSSAEEPHWKVAVAVSADTAIYPTEYAWKTTRYTSGPDYQNGAWWNTSTNVIQSGTIRDDQDYLGIALKCWEEDTPIDHTQVDGGDDNYLYDAGNNSRKGDGGISSYLRGNQDNFHGKDGDTGEFELKYLFVTYYKVEIDVYWNYTKPVNPGFTLSAATSSQFTITKGSVGYYRVTRMYYDVSTDSGFSNIIQSSYFTSSTKTITGLEPGTTYYVRVRGYNEAGTGTNTSTKTIQTILPIPANATNIFPDDDVADMPRTVTVNWRYNGDGSPTGFKVMQGGVQVGDPIEYTTDKLYNKQLNQAAFGSVVDWKVIPYNATGDCANPTQWSFTVMAEPANPDEEPAEVVYEEVQNYTGTTPPQIVFPEINFGNGNVSPTVDLTFGTEVTALNVPIQVQDQPNTALPNPANCGAALNLTIPNGRTTRIVFDFQGGFIPTELVHLNGGVWEVVETVAHDVVFTQGQVAFDWTLAARGDDEFAVNKGGEDSTLPIELSSFTAIATSENYAQINWETQSETDLSGYNIYRNNEIDSENSFKLNIELISGNNSSNGANYQFIDETVESTEVYYYWLESIDFDGTTEMFGPVSINFNASYLVVENLEINSENYSDVTINWATTDVSEEVVFYNIFRNTTLDFENSVKLNSSNIYVENGNEENYQFIDENAELGENYFYWVTANSWDNMLMIIQPISFELAHTEFSNFAASTNSEQISLNWNTVYELEMNSFQILKSSTALFSDAEVIENFTAQNNLNNNCYNFEDENIEQGETYYYWVKGTANNRSDEYISDMQKVEVPFMSKLMAAYPNPFNPTTTIKFSVENPQNASLNIFNIMGQKVRSFDIIQKGEQEVVWNGKDNSGSKVSSGVYFINLNSPTSNDMQKVLLLK